MQAADPRGLVPLAYFEMLDVRPVMGAAYLRKTKITTGGTTVVGDFERRNAALTMNRMSQVWSLILSCCLMTVIRTPAASTVGAQSWETLESARLTTAERHDVISVVEASAFDTPDSWNAELRLERVDLGTSRGLVVTGTSLLCGATGNCQIFVLRQLGGRWVSLFRPRQAPIVETFHFDIHRSQGIRDLIVRTNAGGAPAPEIRYQFDGHVYRK